jgi:hypothetical protein
MWPPERMPRRPQSRDLSQRRISHVTASAGAPITRRIRQRRIVLDQLSRADWTIRHLSFCCGGSRGQPSLRHDRVRIRRPGAVWPHSHGSTPADNTPFPVALMQRAVYLAKDHLLDVMAPPGPHLLPRCPKTGAVRRPAPAASDPALGAETRARPDRMAVQPLPPAADALGSSQVSGPPEHADQRPPWRSGRTSQKRTLVHCWS